MTHTPSRVELLQSYLQRLNQGESLEQVRADFVKTFTNVDAAEIMDAEQKLLAAGTPIEDMQKLCDIHSALFHDMTDTEKQCHTQEEIEAWIHKKNAPAVNGTDRAAKALALTKVTGHPLETFTRENEALQAFLDEANKVLADQGDVAPLLNRIKEVTIHYAKKGDLLYPLLKVNYGIAGPSSVMWTVDDELRDELNALCRPDIPHDADWKTRVQTVLQQVGEMIFKERNILFALCAASFSPVEWEGIYEDAKDYADCLGVTPHVWPEAEEHAAAQPQELPHFDGEINMPGGTLTLAQLTAMLNTMPIEITFIDDQDINRYFNEGPKDFKRPKAALGREVYTCHPPKVEPMVRSIIHSFREGHSNNVTRWATKRGRVMLVQYFAVRDKAGKFLGTLELVQDMEFAKEHFQK